MVIIIKISTTLNNITSKCPIIMEDQHHRDLDQIQLIKHLTLLNRSVIFIFLNTNKIQQKNFFFQKF